MNKGTVTLLRKVLMLMGSEDSTMEAKDRVVCCEFLAFSQPCVAGRHSR